jgi:outer membrane protein
MKSSRMRLPIYSLFVCLFAAFAAVAQQPDPSTPQPAPPTDLTKVAAVQTKPASYGLGPAALSRVGVQQAAPLPLSLGDAVRRALEANNDIEISRDTERFQETQVRALEGFYDPVFAIQPTYTHNSTTGSAATNDFRVNSSFSHNLRRGGGNYQVFFNNSRTENAFAQAQVTSGSVSSTGSAVYSSSSGFNFNQPLFRNRGIDSTRRSILIAQRRLEQNDADFRLSATTTISNVARAYWDYVFSMRNQQNEVANVNLARENLRQIEARIDAGAAAPIARAEVATELANREGSLLLATQQVSIAENSLKQLILRDPLQAEWQMSITPTDKPVINVDTVNLEQALADAMDNRFELRRLKMQKEINAVDIRYFKNQLKPQIDLNTTFSLDGLARSGTSTTTTSNLVTGSTDVFLLNSLNATRTALNLPTFVNPVVTIPASPGFLFGGFNRSLANLFRTDAPNFTIGATISFPLRNRTAKANLEGARITEHQIDAQLRAQEQTVVVDVRNAVQALDTNRQRVLTARRARENAEIQLTGEQKLYEQGKSTTFILFQRENTLNNARNAEIRAETDYSKALTDLQRATATVFRANNITVTSPVRLP